MANIIKKYDHKMIKEIREQAVVARKLIEKYLDCGKKSVNIPELQELSDKIITAKKIIFIACGTSYYAGIYGKYIFEGLGQIDCEVEYADEFISRESIIEENSLAFVMSQSGETSDVVSAAELAKQKGSTVIGITNGVDSSLVKKCDAVIYNDAGAELAMAATKSYTSQLLLLSIIAISFAITRGVPSGKKMDELFLEFGQLPEKIDQIFSAEDEIKKIADKYVKNDSLIVLGRKYNYLTALEGAHKMKETTYVHVEGSTSEEFIHGPNAIIDRNFPCIFLIPRDSVYQDNVKVYEKVNTEGADNFVITTLGNSDFKTANTIFLSEVCEQLSSILYVIPLQIFAYYLACAKGIDVDNLRNISKSIVK